MTTIAFGKVNSDKKLIFVLLCLGNITISVNTGAVAAAIPLIGQDLHQPDFVVSKIVVFYMIPYGLGALLYAPLTRILSYRLILVIASLSYAFFSLLSGLSHSLDTILWAQIGAGIAAASSTPLSLMIIGELFDKDMRGRLVGGYFGSSFLAATMGMIFMGLVDWHWLFFIPMILALMTASGLVGLRLDLLDRVHDSSVNYFKALGRPEIRNVFIFIFVMSALYHAVHKWYGTYMVHEYGLDKKTISMFLIIAALCGLSGQQIGGYLSDKKGRLVACFVGIFILAFGTMLLAGHYYLFAIPIILGLISMGWTINHNSVSTILTDFPDDDRPIMASLNSAVRFISGGLGFSLSRVFVEKSFPLTFLGIGILFFLVSLIIKRVIPALETGRPRQGAKYEGRFDG